MNIKSLKLNFSFFKIPIQLGLSIVAAALVTGCNTMYTSDSATIEEVKTLNPQSKTSISDDDISVIRYGRYRLVEVGATNAQKDLLAQVIDITIPTPSKKQSATVADAMRYVLLQSGYELCDSQTISVFENFDLPVAHYHLGPITVKDALSVLAGPGWLLQLDDFSRKICFIPVEQSSNAIETNKRKDNR